MAAWADFKIRFQGTLDEFNSWVGVFKKTIMVERAEKVDKFPELRDDLPTYLALGDLVELLQYDPINTLLDEHASQRGWSKFVHERDWKDDESKGFIIALYLNQPHMQISDLIPFEYMYDARVEGFTWVSISSFPLVIITANEDQTFEAQFGEDYLFRNQVSALSYIPTRYER